MFITNISYLIFFSIFKSIELIEKFYDYISDDTFILLFFDDNNKNDEDNTFIEKLTNINISPIIVKNQRIKLFKIFFWILSGMSYSNSIFSFILNFLSNGNKG